MDQLIPGEHDLELDIEAGLAHATQESTSDTVSGNNGVSFGVSEKTDDDLNYPLMGTTEKTSSQSLDLSGGKRNDIVKVKKSRKASKPPRPPKGPSFTANDHKCLLCKCITKNVFKLHSFAGLFAGNMTMSSDNSPAPTGSPNTQLISVQFYNDFAPVEQTDPSPATSYRYTRKRVSGAEED
ncbi:hypothetical protein IGI04_039240 [Brassica rapa subsp. trilocularis]|uniref:Uncharacterized protein n=1 Tax=Brassica rapa subsp. trilocularis TaxID=1813537 RepID=A0ABQ7KKD9_BRACM|nr:hypothetical protein IGI04_039240 [Brassica rapa subsp. trilocularis]